MSVNLVPEIRTDSLAIDERDFFSRENDPQRPSRMDGSIEAGCLTEGHHRLLRFTILCYNKGDKAFEIGKPEDRPDIFARPAELGFPKARHQWYMREKFYLYTLRNDSGSVNLSGYKRPWCLADFKRFDCSRMGIDPGLADTYQSDLECQFIVIEGLEDGEYTIEALANAPSVLAFKRGNTEKILFEEDNYNDNCVAIRIKIRGNDLPEYLGPGICKMM
jgi:hypothetical protein